MYEFSEEHWGDGEFYSFQIERADQPSLCQTKRLIGWRRFERSLYSGVQNEEASRTEMKHIFMIIPYLNFKIIIHSI